MPEKRYTDRPDPRFRAVEALTSIDEGAPLEAAVERTVGDLPPRDRALHHELVTGAVRHRLALDSLIDAYRHAGAGDLSVTVRNNLRVALHQLLHLDRIPDHAAVDSAVSIARRLDGDGAARLVNGMLRTLLRSESLPWPDQENDPVEHLAVTRSHPRWLAERWVGRYGAGEAEELMESNNERPAMTLRVNPLRTSVDEVVEYLHSLGLDPQPGLYDPLTISVTGFSPVGDPAFLDGAFTVQDEASILVARLTGVQPGMRVIDLCAAPGGKTGAMAEMMGGEGAITAVEVSERGAGRVGGAMRRLRLDEVVMLHHADGREVDVPPADVVLVDAPCSGLGVIRKKPDIKWRRAPEQFAALTELQSELLASGGRLVAPGGLLVYATCTTEPEENEEIVERFLREHPEFTLEPASSVLPEEVCDGAWLRTLPHRHGVDGAFAARLRRST